MLGLFSLERRGLMWKKPPSCDWPRDHQINVMLTDSKEIEGHGSWHNMSPELWKYLSIGRGVWKLIGIQKKTGDEKKGGKKLYQDLLISKTLSSMIKISELQITRCLKHHYMLALFSYTFLGIRWGPCQTGCWARRMSALTRYNCSNVLSTPGWH